MPQRHREPYPDEYRDQIVELARAGRTPRKLAAEYEPSEQATPNWIVQADLDEGRRQDGLTTEERDELRRLRRENKKLKEEREILRESRILVRPRGGLEAQQANIRTLS